MRPIILVYDRYHPRLLIIYWFLNDGLQTVCLFQTLLTSYFRTWAQLCLKSKFQNRASVAVAEEIEKYDLLYQTGEKCFIFQVSDPEGVYSMSYIAKLRTCAIGEGEHWLWSAAEAALRLFMCRWNANNNILTGKDGSGCSIFPAFHRRFNWQQCWWLCHLSESRCGEK